ncbi:MAG: OmpA family protein [Gemmatimonadetes bacterium]|nr:OmpA family protein [Gemmatimonadota bacterium]
MRKEARRVIVATLCLLLVGACGRRTPPPAPAPAQPPPPPAQPAPPPPPTADPDAAARERAAAAARARATLAERIYFDFDRFGIRTDQSPRLDAKVPILRANPSVRLRIEGHADERGSVEYNLALGLRRANAARQYLTGLGIVESRLDVISYGEERPAIARSDEAAWAENRRAEFPIVAGEIALRP